ncbi:ABC-type Fe3+-hydroxamate transport system, periplasmic component [Halorhabdus sp. BNX81]|nr:ABC-type Fe3+-hydroxamate transport system, periplasmic component [Halorhabdus sp. BNX81]
MEQRRRHVLERLGVLGITALAGCNTLSSDTTNAETDTRSDHNPSITSQHTEGRSPTAPPTPPSTQTTKLSAGDGDADDSLGQSVAVSGDGSTVVVGTNTDEDPNGRGSGSAYVYSNAGGSWIQEAKLAPTDGDLEDWFGMSVTISGDGSIAIIGAPGDEDPNGPTAGSAYVFTKAGEDWTRETKLAASDGDAGDRFGRSVAISGDGSTAIIGASWDADPNGTSAGAAYVFSQSSGSWSQEAKLSADDGEPKDGLGNPVATSRDGSTAIAGTSGGTSAYLFSKTGGSWTQEAKLAIDDGNVTGGFGWSVTVAGDGSTAIVGVPFEEDMLNDSGSAYVFSKAGGSWTQEAKLVPSDRGAGDFFGRSVAISDNSAIATVSAITATKSGTFSSGSAYVFTKADGDWTQEAKLAADDSDTGDQLGFSMALSGDGSTAVAGAPGDDDPNGEDAGSAYIFE